MDTLSFLMLLLFLLLLSGFFSGGEVALIALNKATIRAMQEHKMINADVIEKIKQNPNRLLITILIGNNLVNISTSVVATYWVSQTFGSEFLGLMTGLLTLVFLIFSEIFPKTLAQKHPQRFSQMVARPILLLEYLFYPLIVALELLLRFSKPLAHRPGHFVTPLGELKAMIQIATEDGYIESNIGEIIRNLFSFDKKEAREIMTTSSSMVMISEKASLEKLRRLFIDSSHSRIPVYGKTKDDIVGIVTMYSLLKAYSRKGLRLKDSDYEKPIVIVPETLIDDLLILFQEQKQQIAIVKQEDSVEGLITMENILEELVGEIFDEKEQDLEFIKKESKDSFLVRYDCPLYEIRRYIKRFEAKEQQFLSIETIFKKHKGLNFECGIEYKIKNYFIKPKCRKDGKIVHFIIRKK